MWRVENIFSDISANLQEELVETLFDTSTVRVERIVSQGHASPDGFWYDQVQDEWVVLLKGEAKLIFEGDDEPIHLNPGDHVAIPAHKRHRVEWTAPAEPSVWLAVFCDATGRKANE